MDPSKTIKALRAKIHTYNHQYYVENAPQVSDQTYDQIFTELQKLEKAYPYLVSPTSPTQQVGDDLTNTFATITHTTPMLSIENTYSETEIKDFEARIKKLLPDKKIKFVAEPKIDGFAVSIKYQDGEYVQGVSRGDGQQGEDITNNIKTIRTLPLHLRGQHPPKGDIEVRGEVFFTHQAFAAINALRKKNKAPLFANPRNSAAGTIKLLNTAAVRKRNLSVFLYTLLGQHTTSTYTDNLKRMQSWGLPIIPHSKISQSIDDVIAYCQSWEQRREALAYDIDGMVIKVNHIAQQNQLGILVPTQR